MLRAFLKSSINDIQFDRAALFSVSVSGLSQETGKS